MTDKTAEEAARECLLAFEAQYGLLSPAEGAALVSSITALLESHASERERAAIERAAGVCDESLRTHMRSVQAAHEAGDPQLAETRAAYASEALILQKRIRFLTPPKDQPARQAKEDA